MSGLALIFGFLAATAALLVQVLASIFIAAPLTSAPTLTLLIGAALIEEGAKLVFLFQLERREGTPITPLPAVLFGTGFIAAEIALLTLSAAALPGFGAFGAIIVVHMVGTLAIAAGLRFRGNFPLSPLFALLAAILIHTLYNSSL